MTFTVALVYGAALVPLVVLAALGVQGRLPRWLLAVYGVAFVFCAFGWEVWLTYGVLDGVPVDARRSPELNRAIPQHLNWLLNSLADAGSICLGGLLLVACAYRFQPAPFLDWRWGAFALLGVWFLGQNLFVELFVYQEQLSGGKPLSWAPLIPTGPWWNPLLFTLGGRTVHLQTQLPWLLMTPLFYATTIACYRSWNEPS